MKLDGGAMFGNASKEQWQKWVKPDEVNCIPIATRCVLLKNTPQGNILIDAGAGNYLPEKILERFCITEGYNALEHNLRVQGVPHTEIDIVLLSHLHFDHIGGLVENKKGSLSLLFPNAKYYVSEGQWNRATKPLHPRDRVYDMVQDIMELMVASGRLIKINEDNLDCLLPTLTLSFSNGHAYRQINSKMTVNGQKYYFPTDLIPGRHWVHLPITMGYDRFPELIINEKKELLEEIHRENGILIFVHDPDIHTCKVEKNDLGRFEVLSL